MVQGCDGKGFSNAHQCQARALSFERTNGFIGFRKFRNPKKALRGLWVSRLAQIFGNPLRTRVPCSIHCAAEHIHDEIGECVRKLVYAFR